MIGQSSSDASSLRVNATPSSHFFDELPCLFHEFGDEGVAATFKRRGVASTIA
jgi:hypothetical protein